MLKCSAIITTLAAAAAADPEHWIGWASARRNREAGVDSQMGLAGFLLMLTISEWLSLWVGDSGDVGPVRDLK